MLEGVPPGLESSFSPPPESCSSPPEIYSPAPESCPPPPYRLSLSLPALAPSPGRWEEVARKRRQRRARLELPERDLHLTWYKMIISAITAVQNDQNQSGESWFLPQTARARYTEFFNTLDFYHDQDNNSDLDDDQHDNYDHQMDDLVAARWFQIIRLFLGFV